MKLDLDVHNIECKPDGRQPRAIEDEEFPFEVISTIAEQESWRKEINRPIYHVHKWWAQRLGSAFRAILIGALSPGGTDVMRRFYEPSRFNGAVVFDPFMGSGTTVGEALKLGCKAIGRDINPVAYFLVRNALQVHSRDEIIKTYQKLSDTVSNEILSYYKCPKTGGTVLYFFWVKTLPCPDCNQDVRLFSKYIFAQHAYPKKHPESQAICPCCGNINEILFDATSATCSSCGHTYSPKKGPAQGTKATCPNCDANFGIAATARGLSHPPHHQMYAKLVLLPDGTKQYLPVDEADHAIYESAKQRLSKESDFFPKVGIDPGYNTNQVINYSYRHWHEMFNDRQLLCLGMLAREIKNIESPNMRDAMACLFSGALEFNNMFASYKGEGTGAVRHMFYHHILKPERTPLEANLWGTPKSSGAFSTMFKSRLLRALDYCADPFELRVEDGRTTKVYGLSDPIGHERADSYQDFLSGKQFYVSCGDSSDTDLPDESVDVVVTDPPFFDNVNYSQLADFFFVWQRHMLGNFERPSTRSDREVQHQDADVFEGRLGDVFRECHRVLRKDGLLVFTYHHSRSEGWTSVLGALSEAGFVITAAQPVKGEMSGATPKNQAKEPIDLDIVIVCRKRDGEPSRDGIDEPAAEAVAARQVQRLRASGRRLSRNDVRVILMGQLIKRASQAKLDDDPAKILGQEVIEEAIERLY